MYEEDGWTGERHFIGYRCKKCKRIFPLDILEVDHITPRASKGSNRPSNLQLLCPPCNKKKGTKLPAGQVKKSLQALNIKQLKFLADKHKVKVKGQIVEDFFDSYRKAPTKSQYINKLAGVVTEKELSAIPKETKKPTKKRKRKKSEDFWW